MLKADLHSHTHFSKDCLTTPEKYVATCLKRGINCIAVTDHNSIQGGLAVRKIAPFQVIVAEEVRTTEGEITGLFLTEEIPARLTPEETVRRIKEQGGLVSVPHPFDRFRGEPLKEGAIQRILPQADII
jgi:predicted metal-dependent phosphoesterase TrpH